MGGLKQGGQPDAGHNETCGVRPWQAALPGMARPRVMPPCPGGPRCAATGWRARRRSADCVRHRSAVRCRAYATPRVPVPARRSNRDRVPPPNSGSSGTISLGLISSRKVATINSARSLSASVWTRASSARMVRGAFMLITDQSLPKLPANLRGPKSQRAKSQRAKSQRAKSEALQSRCPTSAGQARACLIGHDPRQMVTRTWLQVDWHRWHGRAMSHVGVDNQALAPQRWKT